MTSSVNVEAIFVRGFKTFLQSFLAAVLIGLTPAVSLSTVRAVLAGAIAAGLSAVMNLFLQPQEAK